MQRRNERRFRKAEGCSYDMHRTGTYCILRSHFAFTTEAANVCIYRTMQCYGRVNMGCLSTLRANGHSSSDCSWYRGQNHTSDCKCKSHRELVSKTYSCIRCTLACHPGRHADCVERSCATYTAQWERTESGAPRCKSVAKSLAVVVQKPLQPWLIAIGQPAVDHSAHRCHNRS